MQGYYILDDVDITETTLYLCGEGFWALFLSRDDLKDWCYNTYELSN